MLRTCALGLALLLAGCAQADTLGGAAAPEIAIAPQPTYENSIRALLDAKCAYCHSAGPSSLKPENAPADLDLSTYATALRADGTVMRGADAIGRWIWDGVLDHPIENYQGATIRRMPLDYGTPLTDRERAGLLAWSDAGSPLDATPLVVTGDANVGLGLFLNEGPTGLACASCHTTDGRGGPLGPRIRLAAATPEKVKQMWLTRVGARPALSDEWAQDLAAYVRTLPEVLR